MSHKYFADQFDNETVLLVFRKHPVVMRRGLIIGMLALLLGVAPALFNPQYLVLGLGLGAGFVLGLILFLPGWIGWHFSVYIVTDQRFIQITQKGMFHRSVVDMALNQIQMVNYEVAGMQQTLLGFGTIVMQTLVGDLVIHEVGHPATIQKKILEILRSEGNSPNASESESDDDTQEDTSEV